MHRLFLFIFFLVCSVNDFYAQTLWESIVEVKNLINKDKFDDAESVLNRIEEQCINTDKDSIKVLYMESKGYILWDKEKYKECIPFLLKAIDIYDNLHIKAQSYLEAFVAIGYSYGRLRDYENAERFYRKALLKSVAVKYNYDIRLNAYMNLGNIYKEKGDTLLAQECFRRASAEDVKVSDYFDFMNHNYMKWQAKMWAEIGDLLDDKKYQEAADKCSELIIGIEKQEGKNEAYIHGAYMKAFLLSRYLDKYDEAIPLYKEVVEIGERNSSTDKRVCGAYCNLALSYAYKGEYSKADALIQESQSCLNRANNGDYPPHAVYRFAGNGAYWTNNYEKAIKYYEIYLSPKYQREKGTNYEDIVTQVSVSYIQSDAPEKAKSLLSSFLKSDEARMKKDNISSLATIYHNLGRAYMLTGYKSDALKYLNKSKDLQTKLYGKVLERTLQYINECVVK